MGDDDLNSKCINYVKWWYENVVSWKRHVLKDLSMDTLRYDTYKNDKQVKLNQEGSEKTVSHSLGSREFAICNLCSYT